MLNAFQSVIHSGFLGEASDLHNLKMWPFLLLCLLVVSPFGCCSPCGTLTDLINCQQDIIHQRQQPVAAELLLDTQIPADTELASWKNWEEGPRMIPVSYGTNVFVQRFSSLKEASAKFEDECADGGARNYWSDHSKFAYEGQGDKRYCASYASEWRYDTSSLCAPSGDYRSYVVIQNRDVVIAIYENTSGEIGKPTNEAIRQLVDQLSNTG